MDDLLQSHTARTMLANSEFLVMLNQAATDRTELARLLNISDNQLSYITNVDSGRGLIKCGSAIVPFMDNFPKNRLYKLMTTKPSEHRWHHRDGGGPRDAARFHGEVLGWIRSRRSRRPHPPSGRR